MKRVSVMLIVLAVVFAFALPTHATLFLRGTDTNGNRLIYDDDLNITWYDYTNPANNWDNQMSWASGLTVDFSGTIYDDWRLPSTVDGPYVFGYDGTTTAGYNITSSEVGHLFYTELGNKGLFDTNGNYQPGWSLTKIGGFQNLQQLGWYVSGTEYSANPSNVWGFTLYEGVQFNLSKNQSVYAMAVRPGDVSTAVPEPATLLLLGSGLAGLAVCRKRLGRKQGRGGQPCGR